MRASILTSAVIVFLLLLSPSLAAAQSEGVQIYNGRDGGGQSQPIPVGTFQVNGKQLGSTEASVKVSKDYFVRFCAEKDGTGKCEEFGEGTHNLTSIDFNFIHVRKGPLPAAATATPTATGSTQAPAGSATALMVYEQLNWQGRGQSFGPGMYRSFRAEFGKINDNQARSIIVAKGYSVRLCSEEGRNYRGAGDCENHEEGRHNLRFSNTISFIEVTDLSDKSPDDEKLPVVLYEDASEVGKMQGFDVGTFSASKGEFKKLGNDQASSIRVKDGYTATLCKDEPQAGAEPADCEVFAPGRKDLKAKKTASYLKVTKQ
ncbi:MAG TPA: hypothetical protein VJV05_07030 [Pyrinomonadaceae bacterium]|nr:hypothetical protein [Pyrinomonadaceae bacterium]